MDHSWLSHVHLIGRQDWHLIFCKIFSIYDMNSFKIWKKQRVKFESNFTAKQFFRPPWATPRHTHPHRHDPSTIQFFHDPNIHVYPPLSMTPTLMYTLLSCQLLYSVHIRVMIRVFQEKSSLKNIHMYFNVHNIMLWSTCSEMENTSSFKRNWTSRSSSSHNDTTITTAEVFWRRRSMEAVLAKTWWRWNQSRFF